MHFLVEARIRTNTRALYARNLSNAMRTHTLLQRATVSTVEARRGEGRGGGRGKGEGDVCVTHGNGVKLTIIIIRLSHVGAFESKRRALIRAPSKVKIPSLPPPDLSARSAFLDLSERERERDLADFFHRK